MKNLFVAIIFLFVSYFGANAQSASDYRILFDKRNVGDGVLKIECAFTIDFAERDSITFDFGGPLQEETIQELHITPDNIRYSLNPSSKHITFYRNHKDKERVRMKYIYKSI